jgi:molecular chaperone DnaK
VASAVGIDLGTTNSVVVVLEGGEPTVIANAEGSRTTPSVVAFAKNAEVLVGEVAKRQAVTNVDRTIRSVKRHIGTDWTVTIDGKKFIPQQISAFILQKLKRDAEAYLGEKITDAVITVPAYFSDAQRQATKEAGTIAGLNVMRVLNEPSAAAMAYHLENGGSARILIFDLGGGSLSVSLVDAGDGVVEVEATSGDNHLGGDDWDQRIVDWLVQDFKSGYGLDLSKDKMALHRLREAAEKAKIELSQSMESQINLPYISHGPDGPLHLDTRLTRAEFQRMTSDLIDRCTAPFKQVIRDANVKIADIDVVLVGGSTRMPAVVDLVKSLTGGREPNKGVNPDEVVAVGACLLPRVFRGEVKGILLLDVTPVSLGIETDGEVPGAPSRSWENEPSPRPKIAIGGKGGVFTKLIERNTTIAVKKSEIFTTADDNQPSVQIQVYQGEREIAAYNKKLGMFDLTGIAPAPRGIPQVEVSFDIDANGIVNVSAKDLGTGKQQSVQITGGSALSKDDIEKMVRDAEEYAEGDRRRREEAEVRNQADTLVYSTEKFLAENDEKVPADVKTEVKDAIADLKKAIKGNDLKTIKTVSEHTITICQKMGTAIYAAAQAAERRDSGRPESAGTGAARTLREAKVRILETKVLLVGEGTVGKTSLAAALRGDPFEEQARTHGIEVHPLELSHPDSGIGMTLRFWDFGGQQVYRTTHQFFFSSDALYLVVWNARAGQDKDDVGGWLNRIRQRIGDNAKVILVATHSDTMEPDLDWAALHRKFPNLLCGHYEVDNRTGRGIQELRAAIVRQAAAQHVEQMLPEAWARARDAILGRASDEPQVSYDDFVASCAAHGVGEPDAVVLAALLHRLGQIIYHGGDEMLSDLVILNPEWLSKAIGHVLEDGPTRADRGILDHARLPLIWQSRPGEPAYKRHHYPYFLRLMEKFDVSYRLEDGRRSLIAQLVPAEEPELPWHRDTPVPDGIRRLALVCRLSASVTGLISALTVRLGYADAGCAGGRASSSATPTPLTRRRRSSSSSGLSSGSRSAPGRPTSSCTSSRTASSTWPGAGPALTTRCSSRARQPSPRAARDGSGCPSCSAPGRGRPS